MEIKYNEKNKTYSFKDNGETKVGFIPISLIEKKINDLNSNMAEQLYIIKEFGEHKGNREKLTMYKEQRDILIELLDERNNTDV